MSETNNPDVQQTVQPDVEKTLDQIVISFKELGNSEDRMSRSKEAESIKSTFYKLLGKLKSEAAAVGEDAVKVFDTVEDEFKSIYADYKRERAEYNKEQDAQRGENLKKKQAVIEKLKALVESQEDVNKSFPAFREIQAEWKEIGPVPTQNYRDLYECYQHYVEKFYDMVKIDHELRDLDFKKNYEAKVAFCEMAEKLAEDDNIVAAFHELQKLHDQWKEFGPVAKEFRDSIWERFGAATSVINKKYQQHFESLKSQQQDNLVEKTKLCEQVEEIAGSEIASSNDWNTLTKKIEEIQTEWRKIGFATKKDNQKIYDRFRAACDKFFERKREFYSQYKDSMNDNLAKKMAIIEEAEALKSSTDWKKTTDLFIGLQKRWKEIGTVPRKKSEQLWTRFRAACDEFFEERDKNVKPENDFYGNLKLKKKLLEEISAYALKGDESDAAAAKDFAAKWAEIGFVPFKEKDAIASAYKEAMAKFPSVRSAVRGKVVSAKDSLVQKYHSLQQDIVTYENNIGFFSNSKNAEPLINQMKERIASAKEELKKLEDEIRKAEEGEE